MSDDDGDRSDEPIEPSDNIVDPPEHYINWVNIVLIPIVIFLVGFYFLVVVPRGVSNGSPVVNTTSNTYSAPYHSDNNWFGSSRSTYSSGNSYSGSWDSSSSTDNNWSSGSGSNSGSWDSGSSSFGGSSSGSWDGGGSDSGSWDGGFIPSGLVRSFI